MEPPLLSRIYRVNPEEVPKPGIGGGFIAIIFAPGFIAPKAKALPTIASTDVSGVLRSSHGFNLTKDVAAFDFCPPDRISNPVIPISSCTPGCFAIKLRNFSTS